LAADKIVDKLLERNLIRPSMSPWASPIVMVKKKDNTYRMCIDYRMLNSVSELDAYSMPLVQDCFDQLAGAKWFCTTDLASGYWQVKMKESSIPKTAFCTRKGLFEWNVLPFGLSSACATFQRLMEKILSDLRFNTLLIYLDDILIYGKSFDETLERLTKYFNKIHETNLKLKPNKCELFQKSVNFLGHIVSENGISCDPDKLKSVREWPVPKDKKELKSFLGLVSYYRRLIPNFSTKAKPLSSLTSKKVDFNWDEKCQEAFTQLKEHLLSEPILGYPKKEGIFILGLYLILTPPM
jgi:hypothetical protein